MSDSKLSPLFRSGYSGSVYRHRRRPGLVAARVLGPVLLLAILLGAFYFVYRQGRRHPVIHVATGVVSASNGHSAASVTAGRWVYAVNPGISWYAAGERTINTDSWPTCLTRGSAGQTKVHFGWIAVPKLGDRRVVLWLQC